VSTFVKFKGLKSIILIRIATDAYQQYCSDNEFQNTHVFDGEE